MYSSLYSLSLALIKCLNKYVKHKLRQFSIVSIIQFAKAILCQMTYLINNISQMSKLWIEHSLVNYTFVELLSHSCAFTNNTWLIVHRLAQLCLSSQAHVFQHAGRGRHLVYTNLWKFHFQIGTAAIGPCSISAMQLI